MRLHENKTLFRQAVQYTADQMGIPAVYVEKDYWVTYALSVLFNREIGKDIVFKGGTALSKCHHIIERFSEDIDLVVLRRKGDTDSRLKAKLKAVSGVLEDVLPETAIEGITNKKGMIRKTAHSYTREFKGDYGQVRDFIILESTWIGYHETYSTKSIVSFVGQMMLDKKQSSIAKDNGLLHFDILAMDPETTLCEKIMSLVRFSYSEDPLGDLKRKIRHCYDLCIFRAMLTTCSEAY